jgi:prepilin-type N-terminal cleavage/methylation domain-containing protein
MIRSTKAFTLVELMVGLMVTSIILTAVATLAFAMSSASTAGGDRAFKQAQIRHASLHISDLIGKCKLICADLGLGADLVIWRADDNDDGRINVNELVYLERGSNNNILRLCRFETTTNPEYTLSQLSQPTTKQQLQNLYPTKYTPLIPDCNNVQFRCPDAAPPRTGLVAITFGFVEDSIERRYEIVTAVRSRADYLLSASNEIVLHDDD